MRFGKDPWRPIIELQAIMLYEAGHCVLQAAGEHAESNLAGSDNHGSRPGRKCTVYWRNLDL
jgi:hypothetical protein